MSSFCVSNNAEVKLLHWRNANPTVGKKIVAELALPLIAVAATVQTIFFGLLLLPAWFISLCGYKKPLNNVTANMMNAGVTVGMTIANFFYYNFGKKANTLSMVGWEAVNQELQDQIDNVSNNILNLGDNGIVCDFTLDPPPSHLIYR